VARSARALAELRATAGGGVDFSVIDWRCVWPRPCWRWRQFGPALSPYAPDEIDWVRLRSAGARQLPLAGTDPLGRDLCAHSCRNARVAADRRG
jgi:hypothetical protein